VLFFSAVVRLRGSHRLQLFRHKQNACASWGGNNTNKNSWSLNKVATYLTIFTLVSGGFYWFGYTIGTFKYDKDKIDLHKIAEKKQKSIDSLQKVTKSEQEGKKVIEKQLQECKKTVDNLQKLSK
jgi:hypothetical protein